MNLRDYHSIQKQLNFRRSELRLFFHLCVDTCLLLACGYLLCRQNWISYLTAQALLPVLFFRSFSQMHEAVHGNLSKHRWVNDAVGVAAGVFSFFPFESWKRLHLEHHFWAGNIEKDPSSKMRKDYNPKQVLKYRVLSLIWRSWIPILGFLQMVVFWIYPLQQLGNATYRTRTKVLVAVSVMIPVITYSAIFLYLPQLCTVAKIGPALLVYLVMLEVINFPHHMDVPAFDGPGKLPILQQHRVTRSSFYPRWFARHFLLNFNFHTEHHLFPTLPWHQLDRARPLIKAALGADYNESLGNAWILKNRNLDLNQFLPLDRQAADRLNEQRHKRAA
jgi:acyl-lipid omega-6 desaturase (Delta-12 desaturase)